MQYEDLARNGLALGAEAAVGYMTGGGSILEKSFKEILEEQIEDIPKNIFLEQVLNLPSAGDIVKDSIPRFTKHSVGNAEEYLEIINQGDRKYLINSPEYREIFIERIEDEMKRIKSTEKFGYLPQDESDAFKEQLLQRLNWIVNMNKNYEEEKAILDEEWDLIKNQWVKELPPIITDSKRRF